MLVRLCTGIKLVMTDIRLKIGRLKKFEWNMRHDQAGIENVGGEVTCKAARV